MKLTSSSRSAVWEPPFLHEAGLSTPTSRVEPEVMQFGGKPQIMKSTSSNVEAESMNSTTFPYKPKTVDSGTCRNRPEPEGSKSASSSDEPKVIATGDNDGRKVDCDICDATFPSFVEFESHIPLASSSRPHLICQYCKEHFAVPGRLQDLMIVNEKFFVCRTCKRTPFLIEVEPTIKKMKKSLRAHNKRCLTSCKTCVKAFRVTSNMHFSTCHQKIRKIKDMQRESKRAKLTTTTEYEVTDVEVNDIKIADYMGQ